MMNSIFMIMNYHYCDSFCKSLIIIFMMMMQCFQYITMNQLNYCLIQSNECDHDDCCFNILPKTGPICDPIPGCAAYFQPECCRNTRPVHTDYGIMYGYAISLDNEYGYQENSKRYIQIWKGIPYAHPPTQKNNLRFHRPIPPMYSTEKYDATYFRSSCSQPNLLWNSLNDRLKYPHEWYKHLTFEQINTEASNINEDCLYLNIYSLYETETLVTNSNSNSNNNMKRYPILVFFHGFDHLTGSANSYPGHVLAQLGIVVITVNYRLGPFGYLATYSSYSENYKNINDYDNDDELKGNYGLWDQIRALEFIKEHAEKFLGDPNQITVIGHGSAAADIALHLLSEKSGRRKPPLFHRVILMSGSDQMEGGFIKHANESEAYARQLAHQVGCDVSSKRSMIKCLRSRTAIELSNAASKTRIHRPNWLTKPWAPTLDYDFIMNTPDYLWTNGFYAHIPLIGGMVVDDGVFHALASIYELDIPLKHWNLLNDTQEYSVNSQLPNPNNEFSGITYDIMRSGFMEMVKNDFALDPISVTNSLLFQYTYWPNRNNSLSQWKMYRSAWTDRLIGSGLIKTLNYHSNHKFINNQLYKSITNQFIPMNLTRMYVFNYKSINDKWSQLIGIYPGSELQYLFGLPLLQLYKTIDEINQQWLIDLSLKPPKYQYTKLDIQMSNYMLSFIMNFIKGSSISSSISSNTSLRLLHNLTWDTYRIENRTYLWLNLIEANNQCQIEYQLKQNYKLHEYAYWNYAYWKQLLWLPRYATVMTISMNLTNDYQVYIVFILIGLLVIVYLIIMLLLIVYCRRRKMLIT
ncbi:Neuroligin-4, X-linked [Schistosoma japonicum]|uniref:Neuroligin-4, X-linked n=1 Tax=Schistosoma japonicum TaxID=6182 RepID=A0A4Z2DEZ1_SCHJA|nr:Neuroligin-4, X-linked [Schistosoma japonicum]